MGMFRKPASDISFSRDDAQRMLPMMIAVLMGFVVLLLSFTFAFSGNVAQATRDITATLQIEVPKQATANDQKLRDIITTLRGHPSVREAHVLSPANMEALLKPWMGEDIALDNLGLPNIIDVEVYPENPPNIAELQTLLARIATGVRIEARGPWVKQVAQASRLVQTSVLGAALLLLSCMFGLVVLVARTGLRLHFHTVRLLHMFGATDDYILRQFQWNMGMLVARGALVGTGIAALLYVSMAHVFHTGDNPMMPSFSTSWLHILSWIVLPIIACLIAMMASRLSVHRMLEKLH
jgi:cell division transport system permease protein